MLKLYSESFQCKMSLPKVESRFKQHNVVWVNKSSNHYKWNKTISLIKIPKRLFNLIKQHSVILIACWMHLRTMAFVPCYKNTLLKHFFVHDHFVLLCCLRTYFHCRGQFLSRTIKPLTFRNIFSKPEISISSSSYSTSLTFAFCLCRSIRIEELLFHAFPQNS